VSTATQLADRGLRGALAAGVALLLAQGLFWLGVGAAENAARPSALDARPWVEFVALDERGEAPADAPRARAPYEPDPNYKARLEGGPGLVRFEIPFEVADPTRDLALYLGARRSIQEIRLNGHVIKPNVPLDSFSGGAGWEPVFYMLPASELRAGTNDVAVLVASEGFAHVFPEFQIGPAEDVARAYGFGRLFNVDLPLVAIGILLFTALLCLAVNWPKADRPRIRALVVLLAIWALGSYSVTFSPPFALSRETTILAYYSLATALPIAAAWYVMHQTGSSPRARGLLLATWATAEAYLVGVTLLVGAALVDPRRWLGSFQYLNLALSVLAGLGGLLLLARALARERGRQGLERVLLMICLTAVLVDTADSVFKLHVPFQPSIPLTFYTAPLAGLLLGLGMVAALAREATLARRVVSTANAVLAERLAAREAQLAAVHEREKLLLAQRAALEERQRIVRDMHDGVGGRLLGLQMQLRHGQPAQDRVEFAVTSSLADLRLMVDTLDAPEATLSDALLGFERRLREQLQGSGIALAFDTALTDADPVFGTGATLQLLRLLQEAVSNACRHARAKHIAIRAARVHGDLVLTVDDDGIGIDPGAPPGRGLASMQARAAALGATLRIEPAAPGTRVCVTLPLPAAST
jgi:two-component system sensor histidine kinase UhpB